jgi:hypothetical protein
MAHLDVRQRLQDAIHASVVAGPYALVIALAALSAFDAGAVARPRGSVVTVPGKPAQYDKRCLIQDNNTGAVLPPNAHGDALFEVLESQKTCPQNALAFRNLLQQKGLTLHPAMVANRGFHNPLPAGSFSFFEAVTGTLNAQKLDFGDFFFGHFTAASIDNTALTSILSPQQAATPDNLLLESVVWDPRKGMFNFYEIRGNGEGGVWFYRGDSYDIVKDIRNLWRDFAPNQILFGDIALGGARLRCSGCHMNGGPIMKELKFPHDSWWREERPLPLGAMRIAPELMPILAAVVDAGRFAEWVKIGDEKLLKSPKYQALKGQTTLQEQLRPLFCEQEVNLESDTRPLETLDEEVRAPVGLFVDSRLLPHGPENLVFPKALYVSALQSFGSAFFDFQSGQTPPGQIDGDHAFETPVKSWSDMRLVDTLVSQGLIDQEFVIDVLAVDMSRPMFSQERCRLLRLVPESASDSWRAEFERNLARVPWPGAKELLENLRKPERSAAHHQKRAREMVGAVQATTPFQWGVTGLVRLLAQQRIAVFHAQISQHPQGQIFEPEFRLIFPTFNLLKPDQQDVAYGGVPGQFWLDPRTGRVELAP